MSGVARRPAEPARFAGPGDASEHKTSDPVFE